MRTIFCTVIALCMTAITAYGQTLKKTNFPDGSGSIVLATGWKMDSAANGAVITSHSNGATMTLGMPAAVVTRGLEAMYPDVPVVFPGTPRVDFTDPVRAALDMFEFTRRQSAGKTTLKLTKAKAIEPVQIPNGRAAIIRFAFSLNGKSYEGFGYYAIMPTDNVQGMFYNSVVIAPTPIFNKTLPTMMAMWKSWSLSDATLKSRIDSATKALGEVDIKGTIDSVTAERRRVAEEAARKFNAYIRQ